MKKKMLCVFMTGILLFSCTSSVYAQEVKIKKEYKKIINEVCELYCVSPEFIEAMIEVESGGNANAKSHCNAIGLMQVIPKWNYERMNRLGITNLYDPRQNILCGVDLVLELFEKYEDPNLVLIAYNCGEYSKEFKNAKATGTQTSYSKKILERSFELEEKHGKHEY